MRNLLIIRNYEKSAYFDAFLRAAKYSIFLLFLVGFQSLFSQVMVSATGRPSSLIICEGDSTFSLLIANTTGSTMTGAELLLDLPSNCQYIPGSINGASELDITNLNQPTFTLPSITNNTAHNVDYNAEIICGYDNTEFFNYIVTYNSSAYTGIDPPLQNYYYPSVVITSITNSSVTVPVNQTVTREFTIEQQGVNASVDTLIFLDEHTADIEVLSVNIGTLIIDPGPGPIFVDTIIITGSDLPGGNNLFDYGETIIISETVKLVGCTDGQSTVNVTWGCYGNYCDYYSAFPSVSPASGVPLIDIIFTGNQQGWGFIDNSGFIEFTVTNNGTGAGTAFDLVTLAGFSSGGGTYYPNGNWLNEIDTFSVNGNLLKSIYNYAAGAINGQYAHYFTYQYTFDPDGAGVGIEDIDGDGFYDDLPIGHSVTVKAHAYYNWQEALLTIPTGNACGRGWTNNAWQGFRYGYDLADQCSNQPGATWIPNSYKTLFMTYNTNTLQHTIPPDIYEATIVWMEQEVVTGTKVENEGCPNDSVIYHLVLPDGIQIAPGTATFKGVSMGAPAITGNTVVYYLNKDRVKSGGWFKVPLKIDCAIPHDPTGTIQTSLKFWCDKTNYPARFFTYWCSESPVFGIQCPPGSCTDPYISNFYVERTTMGWIDNQLSKRVDPSAPGINLNYAMARDSVRIEASGILNGPTDSLYFELRHDNLPGNWANQLFFDYISDTLYFYNFETNDWDTCINLSPLITNGSTSSLMLDMSNLTQPGGCLYGKSYTDGDSIRYVIHGQVKNIARTNWETVPALRANFHNLEFNKAEYCNDLGVTFNILGSNLVYVNNTYINPTIIEGCDDFNFFGQIYRWLDACDGEIAFPNEVRPFVVLDSITFIIPEGYIYHTGSSLHQFRFIDGTFTSEPIGDPIIEYAVGETRLTYVRDPSWSYSHYYDCSRDQDRVQFTATPSCQASSTVSYEIQTTGRYQFYADGIGISQSDNANGNKPYTPADVVLTPLITTAEGRLDTVSWEVRLCNITNVDSDNNWLAFENVSEGIEILELIDITLPSSPVLIPVSEYSPGKSWGQLGTIDANICKVYLVKATYSSCSYDSLLVRHSFNCAGYPVNPELGYPPTAYSCNENNTYLFLDPKDVDLSLSVTSPANPVNLCDTLMYEAEVTNTLLSYGYNLTLTVTVPPGVSFLPSTSEFKYPYTTGSYVIVNDPVNLPAGSNQWVFDISSDPFGTFLLKGVDSIPKNGYRLRFRIMTDCDLISGSSIRLTASASNACGDFKNRSSFTSPILIDGLPTNVNLYVLSTESDEYLPTCSNSSTIRTKVINLGPNNVSDIELLTASIDDAYDYVPGSLIPIHNGPTGVANNLVIGGVRYLQFAIQPNLNVNDSIVFSYELIDVDPGSLECDTIPLTTSAMLVATVACDNEPGGSCLIQSITTSLTTNLAVRKDNVDFGSFSAVSIPDGTSAELITIDYSIHNSGEHPFTSDSLDVVFVHDANGNGLPDESGADSLYYQRIGVENLPVGDSVLSTAVFSVAADKVCNMLAAIRLSEDTCICSETVLQISNIHLFNAGSDTMVCVQNPLLIGMDSIEGQTYIWAPSNYLTSSTISNPEFTYTGSLIQSDTIAYQLITTRPGGCITRDTVNIIVYPFATANAGSDESICETFPFDFSTSTVLPTTNNAETLLWFGGTGTFNISDTLFPVYTPGIGEVGAIELFLVAYSHLNCSQDTSLMILTLDTLPNPNIIYSPNNSICVNEMISFFGSNTNSTNITSWLWDFGDGNTASVQDTTHAYSQSGTYYISLSLNNGYGCVDSIIDSVFVNELPQAYFDINPTDTVCAELPFNFDASSTTNIISWDWDFGDNTTGTGQNISHAYDISNTYIVQLFVENYNTCADTVIDSVYVRQLAVASFSMLPQDTSCLFEVVNFEGISSDNVVLWNWDFGDGGTDSGQNVSHVYTQTGSYIVSMFFEDEYSCTDTITDTVFIRQLPIADFIIATADTSCIDETIYFDGNSVDNINIWDWDFGDGSIASGQNVTHSYSQPGTYTIELVYTDVVGCSDTITHQKIIDDPFIDFDINPDPSCQEYTVYFNSFGDNIAHADYIWDFGDGVSTAIGYNANYVYTQPGDYTITLSVCSKTIQQILTVNPTCVVDAGGNQATCQDVYFNYNNSVTPPTASGFSSVYWYTDGIGNFDDPTLVTPTYFPDSTEGAIQIDTIHMTMVGYGMLPCENDTSTMELYVVPGAYAEAGSDENSCIGYSYDFANSTDSAFATNYVVLYWSTSGTGYFVDPNVEQPIYIPGPNEIGPVTLTMVASNIINCDSIDHMVLTIRPEYEILFDTSICYNDSLYVQGDWQYSSGTFYDTLQSIYGCDSVIVTNLTIRPKIDKSFTISSGDSICLEEEVIFIQTGSANLTNWLWEFGDGNTSTEENPAYTYDASGIYDVVFSYADYNGCFDSVVRQVQVFELPDVSFTINLDNACVDFPVEFYGISNYDIAFWDWDYGDGQTGTGQNTSHIYSNWGDMTVTLTVTNINGCSETTFQYLHVLQPSNADFTYNMIVCDSMQFTDLSTCPEGYNIVMWDWDFDDGGTSNLQNPTHTFPSNNVPGGVTYNVSLVITSDSSGFLCYNSVTHSVLVPSNPDIFFTWNPEPTCLGDLTYFFGGSGYSISQWYWDFDDGNFSLEENASNLYANTGTYDVILSIIDTNGCVNTLSKIITVDSVPEVSFTMSDSVICHGGSISFFGTGSSDVTVWYWEFGDGSFSYDQNPIHFYPTDGTYTVSLTAITASGCSTTTTDQVLILPGPTADYIYANLTCSSVIFTDLSTAPTGYNIVDWFWDFDDGFTATVQNPSHSFVGGIGVYDVKLIVTADSSGFSCTNTIIQTVQTPGLPSVYFTWDPEPTMLGDATSFFGTSGNSIVDWYWDFGDGNFATTQSATNTFATVGTFNVNLTITDIDGCVNSIIHQVSVTYAPELDFTWNYSCEGEQVQFTVLDPPTDIPAVTSWYWDFGDGGVSTNMDPIHVYIIAGTYNVSLTIVDTMNATNTVFKSITVNPLPTALFSIESSTCESNPVLFHDFSTTQTGVIIEWIWDFGDGNTITVVFPNNPDVTYTYATTGTFIVTLTITNSDSCSNSTQHEVITTTSPMATFNYSSGCVGGPVTFTDTSIENGGGTIINWNWNFDDPASGSDNTSVLQNPIHQFNTSGDYDVQLIITNINGCYDTINSTVTIVDEPEVDFAFADVCLGSETQFTVDETITNVGEVQTWAWSFGDGNTSSLQNPTHNYAAIGDYTVTLVIVTTDGCSASITHTVRINPLPNPNFENTAPACLNDTVYFTDLSISPNGLIISWHWDFGDGTEITIEAPNNPDVSHIFTYDATFAVALTTIDSDSCENTIIQNVEVVPSPIADYTFEEICYDEPVYFTDLSTTNGGTDLMSWEWFFGDPNSGIENYSTLQNPTHVFSEPGTYTTTLIIVSTIGCNDTIEQEITVEPPPEVDFTMLDDSICQGESAEFTGISANEISTWFWDFGDGGYSIEQNPSYTYGAPGTYTVTLTVTEIGPDECQNSVSHTISVNDAPEANFDYGNNCMGDSTYFTDLSYSQNGFIASWEWDFGDGNTSIEEDPIHYYQDNDEYTVTLISMDNYGCKDTITQWIQVFDKPLPDFIWNQVCDPEGQVNFFNESEPGEDGSPIIGWDWNLYDGYYSTEIDPSYIYPETDTCYTVILEITDGNGCIATDTNDQICLYRTLTIDFTSTQECLGTSTFFQAAYDPTSDSVDSYTWKFNDGSPLEVTEYDTISHIFPNPNTYIVELMVKDTSGCITTTYHEVIIDSLPIPQFINTTVSCYTPTEFNDISLGRGEFVESWYWDFGDINSGANNYSIEQNPQHLYGLFDSTYQVKLMIINSNGCTDSIVQDVTKAPCLIADFELVESTCARFETFMIDSSLIYSHNVTITHWYWNFGDGETIDYDTYQDTIFHVFESSDEYAVQLIIESNVSGISYFDTTSRNIISYPTPTASIDVNNNCMGDTTRFYDNSFDNGVPISSWLWNFDDDTYLADTTEQNPIYYYPDFNTYTVQLNVLNQFGCFDRANREVSIYKPPDAAFSLDVACKSYYTYFKDESISDSSSIFRYSWNFGDTLTLSDISNLQNPSYIFNESGNYIVRFEIIDNNNCSDTISDEIEVSTIPTSDFIIIDTVQQGQIYLNNLSDGKLTYYWDFDYNHGLSSTEINPTHQYYEDGNYNIMLVSYNDQGCPDTTYQLYEVLFTNLFVPNAFVPSNYNPELQKFKPIGINIKSYKLEIYSTWGNLVFKSTKLEKGSPAEGWDGKYEGEELPTGSFIWHITALFENGKLWKGSDNGDGNTSTTGTVILIR